jgi:hypothetical protein
VLGRRGGPKPGRWVRRSAAIVFVAVRIWFRLRDGRLKPGRRVRRSAAIVVVSLGFGLTLG